MQSAGEPLTYFRRAGGMPEVEEARRDEVAAVLLGGYCFGYRCR